MKIEINVMDGNSCTYLDYDQLKITFNIIQSKGFKKMCKEEITGVEVFWVVPEFRILRLALYSLKKSGHDVIKLF